MRHGTPESPYYLALKPLDGFKICRICGNPTKYRPTPLIWFDVIGDPKTGSHKAIRPRMCFNCYWRAVEMVDFLSETISSPAFRELPHVLVIRKLMRG